MQSLPSIEGSQQATRTDIYRLRGRIDNVERSFTARIDEVELNLNARIDDLTTRIDRFEHSVTARFDG